MKAKFVIYNSLIVITVVEMAIIRAYRESIKYKDRTKCLVILQKLSFKHDLSLLKPSWA